MQSDGGQFEEITEEQAEQFKRDGRGGIILREGAEVLAKNKNDVGALHLIESLGGRFVRVRALPGESLLCKCGEEVTIHECYFLVWKKLKERRLVLQGVPPSPTVEQREE